MLLGVHIDENLNQTYKNDLVAKLNTENGILSKKINYDNQKVLRSIYLAIFDSNLSYHLLSYKKKLKIR